MPLAKRIICSILHDGVGNMLKPMGFSRPARPIGSLMQGIKVMAMRNIDELCLIDILATEQGRKPDFTKIKEYARELACPLMVGGGIKTLDDVKEVLDSGGDTMLLHNRSSFFVERVASFIGSANTAYNLVYTKQDSVDKIIRDARDIEQSGAGEIILTSKDRDGTMQGYDIVTIAGVSNAVLIPVIASGGCSSPYHMHEALTAGADAVMAGAMWQFTDVTPKSAAKYLLEKGHEVRVE